MNHKPMLNAYPDSLGGNLGDIVTLLKTEAMQDVFSSFYILPSLYHSDLDRGFSVIDYDLNEQLADREDLDQLKNMGIDLKLDFILNHASAQSPQFQDLVEKGRLLRTAIFHRLEPLLGRAWNHDGGRLYPAGGKLPEADVFPQTRAADPDGGISGWKKVPYWNTFYQEVHGRHYLGQMDVNIQSPKVWEFYRETLEKIASYGAAIVRLDAFAYAPKTPGKKNFLNDPETWELLQKIHALAEPLGLTLLPEIHAAYDEKYTRRLQKKAMRPTTFSCRDWSLMRLRTGAEHTLRHGRRKLWKEDLHGQHAWLSRRHPASGFKGTASKEEIQSLIDRIVSRGGMVKNLHGQKNLYYQVNATYYSALGESDEKCFWRGPSRCLCRANRRSGIWICLPEK